VTRAAQRAVCAKTFPRPQAMVVAREKTFELNFFRPPPLVTRRIINNVPAQMCVTRAEKFFVARKSRPREEKRMCAKISSRISIVRSFIGC